MWPEISQRLLISLRSECTKKTVKKTFNFKPYFYLNVCPVAKVFPVVPGGEKPVLREDGDREGGGVVVLLPNTALRQHMGHLKKLTLFYS